MIREALAKAVSSKEFYIDGRDLVAKAEMTHVERNTFDILNKFFVKYGRLPTREELLLFLDEIPEAEQKFIQDYKDLVNGIYKAGAADVVDAKVLLTELKERIAKKHIRDRIVRIADTFEQRTTEEIMTDLQDLLFSGPEVRDRKIVLNASEVEHNIPIIKYQATEKVPTMLTGIDNVLYGGIGVRELTTIVAPSSRGKTAFLINMMHGFLMQGYNVLYITLEMSVVDILRRLYRRILYKDKSFLADGYEAPMREWLGKFFGASKANGKILYCPANTMSVEDIKTELVRMEIRGDFVPQVIVIDNLDLMTSRTKSIRQKDSWQFWRMVVDDLREIPLMQGIPIITSTQATRKSVEKTLVTEVDVGESYGKVQSSDVVLSLNQTPEELDNKRIRLSVIKNRDYIRNTEVELFIDLDKMLICDLIFAQTNGWL